MGRTVASYRQALENEILKWDGFKKALRSKDAKAFDLMLNACRMYASAASMSTRPVLLEAMVMSVLLSHEEALTEIREKLDRIEQRLLKP